MKYLGDNCKTFGRAQIVVLKTGIKLLSLKITANSLPLESQVISTIVPPNL